LFPAIGLLPYGGYSEYVIVNKEHVIPIEKNFPLKDAAGIPETWLTAYNLTKFLNNVN